MKIVLHIERHVSKICQNLSTPRHRHRDWWSPSSKKKKKSSPSVLFLICPCGEEKMSPEQDYFSVSFLRTSDKLSRRERPAGGGKFVVWSLEGRTSLTSDRQLGNKHGSGTNAMGRTWVCPLTNLGTLPQGESTWGSVMLYRITILRSFRHCHWRRMNFSCLNR